MFLSSREHETSFSRKREGIKKYSSVVDDFPNWAKDALSSTMGSVHVTARDSFEIYLSGLRNVSPAEDFVIFRKRFAEIFQEKGHMILKRLMENRKNHTDHYFTNDYFGQEFRDLFKLEQRKRKRGFCPCGGVYFGEKGNRNINTVDRYNKAAKKVGLVGIGPEKKISGGIRHRKEEYSVKWR